MITKYLSGGALFDPIALRTIYLSKEECISVENFSINGKKILNDFNFNVESASAAFIVDFTNKSYHFIYPKVADLSFLSKIYREKLGVTGDVSKISSYRILLTDKCNMQCDYCFVDTNTGNPGMSFSDVSKGLELLAGMRERGQEFSYQWFGGEPLIKKNLIIEADEYASLLAKRRDLIHRPTVVTNGTILTDKLLKHFVKFNYGVGVSIDGSPEINSLNRRFLSGKGTESKIEKNIQKLLKEGVHVGVNITPIHESKEQLISSIDYVLGLGVRFIYVNSPIPINGFWVKDGASWANSLHSARLHVLSHGGMLFSHIDRVFQAIDSRIPRIFEHLQSCGGVNVTLLPKVKLSVLDLNWRDSQYIFSLGEIQEKPELLNNSKKSLHPLPECNTCIAHHICGGPSINDQLLTKNVIPSPEYCRFFKAATMTALTDNSGLQ